MRILFRFILGTIGVVFLVAGIAVAGVSFGSDDAGYYTSPEYVLRTESAAITSDRFDLTPNPADWLPVGFASARITIRSLNGAPIFLGIGPSDAVDQFLAGVAHDEVVDVGAGGAELVVRTVAGVPAGALPAAQTFWDLSATTRDQQTVTWDLRSGDWKVVVMNGEGGAGVDVGVRFGVRLPGLLWVGIGMAAVGALFSLVALLALRRRR